MKDIKQAVKRNQWRFYTKINARLSVEARFVMKSIENMLAAQKKKGVSKNRETIATIIDQDKYSTRKKLDQAWNKLVITIEDAAILADVKRSCSETIEGLRKRNKEDRFFSLETVDFYKGELSIARFIEMLQLGKTTNTLNYTAYRLIDDFTRYCRAIDDFNRTHADKEELALIRSFRYELGKRLYGLLSKQSQTDLQNQYGKSPRQCVQLLRDAISQDNEVRFQKMIDNDDQRVLRVIADYLMFWQGDKRLPVFGKARYKYFISFLGNLVEAGQAPLNKIIAGCLLRNRQYSPPEKVMNILERNDITEKTLRIIMTYLFRLTPSVLDITIQRIGAIFETIEGDMGRPDYLMNIQYLSEEMSVPRQVEKIFLDLVRTGLLDLNIVKIRELHEKITGINVGYSQKKGEVIKDLFNRGKANATQRVDQIESNEEVLLVADSHFTHIVGLFMSLFGPESIPILMLQEMPRELKEKIIGSLSPTSARKVYTALSMCLNCRYLNEHMIYEKSRFKETLETLFLSSEEPLFCGLSAGSNRSDCLHDPAISGYQKAFLKQVNQYLNDAGVKVNGMVS